MADKDDLTNDPVDNPEQGGQGAVGDEISGGEAPGEGAPREKLEAVERERDQYLELARRARADYINLQRRMEAQSDTIREEARHEFAKDMLSVLDDLELAIKHAREGQDCQAMAEGIELVRVKFTTALSRYGIEPIEAVGMPFDHNLHHAIAQHPTDEAAPGTVFAVARNGYTAQGKLLRPAQVIVAVKPEGAAAGGDEG